eukprot:s1144_g9.t1
MHALLRSGGLTTQQVLERREESGQNAIHVRVPGRLESLVTEFSNFYYVFNSVAFLTYIAFTTWNIGILWFLMTLGAGVYKGLVVTRPNQQRVAELAKVRQQCLVLRDGAWLDVESSEIVLGDIVQVKGMGVEIPCDGLLMSGSLIVNESMLTGEPMPVAKVAVQDVESYDIRVKSNKVYAGTWVIESEDDHALVYCTDVGALTTRGQLVRMVLFPTSVHFKYVDQLPVVYGLMCVYAFILVIFKSLLIDEGSGVVKFLNILCSLIGALSPMLPVIPVAGKISVMVFDKTGTITKSGMDFTAVQPAQMACFQPRLATDGDVARLSNSMPEVLRRALTLCHTVKKLQDGRLVGNELECAMVRRMADEAERPGDEIVVRELHFDHLSMTSGVVLRRQNVLEAFVKGSPAMIKSRCKPSSLPADYDSVVMRYAKANFYTISICHKSIPELSDQEVNELPRAELEQDLIFDGLLLFQNEMKATPSPRKEGAIRSVICTGDSELTGIAIGKQCGIVTGPCFRGNVEPSVDGGTLVFTDPEKDDCPVDVQLDPQSQLALSRGAWLYLRQQPQLLAALGPRCVVFGQMKPDDKINVIKHFQSQGLIVGMAGDGGNDCGALRASHAGIALSKAEASLVAPFSSGRVERNSGQISLILAMGCGGMTVPDLIREGRACLATNLATFSYFIVQALSIYTIMSKLGRDGRPDGAMISMMTCNVVFGEWVFMLKDIGLGMVMTFYMTRSKALPFLAKVRPTATLLGFRTACTIGTQVLLNVVFFLASRELLYAQPWYDRLNPVHDINIASHMWMLRGDNYDGALTAICCTASLANVAYVNTYGGNFRRNICRNVGINVVYLLSMGLVGVLTLSTPNPLNCIFRVNCDTPNSLACGAIPIVDEVSVKPWQNHSRSLVSDIWLPSKDSKCLPPSPTLAAIPLDHPWISTGKGFSVQGCIGPNNCFSADFKWMLAALLLLQTFLHHFFMKFVLLGPVARFIRKRQHHGHGESAAQGGAFLGGGIRGASSFSAICPPKGGDRSCDPKDLEQGTQKDPRASLHSGFVMDPVL